MNSRSSFLAAFAVLTAAMAFVAGCGKRPKPVPDTGLLKVTVATPKVDKVILFTDLTGTVEAPQSVDVRARVSGFIKEVLFKEGDTVTGVIHLWDMEVYPGDPLFKIDPVTYEADLKQALGQVAVYQAKLVLAEKDEARSKAAFDKNVASKQEYETFVAQTLVAKAYLDASDGPVIKAKQNLDWTTVRAPITGKIDRARLTRGNVVTGGETQGTVLTTIVSQDPMYVYFDVDDQTVTFYQRLFNEGKLKSAAEGGKNQVDIKLLGDDKYAPGGEEYPRHGNIDFASNQLNPNTGTLSVRAVFPNPDHMLIPGRYVRGRVPLGVPLENGILIPDAAVVTEQSKKYVYVVGADNKTVRKPVELGPLSKGLRLVQSGLTPQDRIIIRGVQRVQPGEPVDTELARSNIPTARPRSSVPWVQSRNGCEPPLSLTFRVYDFRRKEETCSPGSSSTAPSSWVISIVIVLGVVPSTLPIAAVSGHHPASRAGSASYRARERKVVAETVAAPIERQVNVEHALHVEHLRQRRLLQPDGHVRSRLGPERIAQVLVQNRVNFPAQLPPDVQRQGLSIKKSRRTFCW
ncbi:MAG: efflux RND transporter periplasmic adaptor subunit [Gemmataceae bacterium]